MKLTLKTVTGVNFSLDAEPTDTVRERPGERDPRVTSRPPRQRRPGCGDWCRHARCGHTRLIRARAASAATRRAKGRGLRGLGEGVGEGVRGEGATHTVRIGRVSYTRACATRARRAPVAGIKEVGGREGPRGSDACTVDSHKRSRRERTSMFRRASSRRDARLPANPSRGRG